MKTIDDIRNAVASALAQTVGDVDAAAIDLSQTLENIGVDSLSFLRLNMTLEQALGISLPDDFSELVATGEEIVAHLDNALKSRVA